MTRRWIVIAVMILAASPGLAGDGQAETTISLALSDCIAMAMRNSLGIAVAVLDPELGAAAVSLAREEFLPVFSLANGWAHESQPSYSWFDGAGAVDQVSIASSVEVRQRLKTGALVSLAFDTARYDTNERGLTINPSYRSLLKLSLRQPLLRDSGAKTARHPIVIAQYALEASIKDVEKTFQETVFSVEEAFWGLVLATDDLKIKEGSLTLARDLLERIRKAVEAGTMPSVNILNAQVQVASREADILKAEAEVRNAEDELKLVTNISAERANADLVRIVPVAAAPEDLPDMTLDEAMSVAMRSRPDLAALGISVQMSEARLGYAKNQTLPDLSLAGSLWSPGLSGTKLVYPEGDPFGDPISAIPGGVSGSLKDVFGFRHANVSLGLNLDIPIRNLTSKAAYAQARIETERAVLELARQRKKVETKIKIALREKTMSRRRVQALRTARDLAERQLGAEEEKLRAGYSTTFFVLQYQSELSVQRSQELAATIDYYLALARLNLELGVNLSANNIRWDRRLGQ